MSKKIIKISEISYLNYENISNKDIPAKVKYLDTGNITKNRISELQDFDTSISELPSRAQRKVKKNTIIYSTVRPNLEHFGILENPPDNLIVSTGFTTIDINDPKIDAKYIYYALTQKHYTEHLHRVAVNNVSSYPSINPDDIGNIELTIPEKKDDQQKIASVLSSLDAKIELNNRINAELEAMAKTLYDYWFVQFDFPDKNGKPYKSSGGKMVWNAELKREIPEGWEVKKLKDIAFTGAGGTPLSTKKEFYENGEIPWINSGEVNQPFIVSTDNFITSLGLKNSNAKMFKKGTILMAMYGATAGKISFIDIEASTNQAICAINPYEHYFSIYIKFGLEDIYKYLVNLSSGSARDNLSQELIRNLNLIIPPKKELYTFHEFAHSSMKKILNNLKQNQQLSELRDFLLPMLMNGQVKVV